MARTIQNTVRIDASPATVWSVLTSFDERPEWDPYYREVRGELARGARLTVRASLNDTDGLVTARPRIVILEPGERLAWANRFVVPGLLDSRQEFRLTSPQADVTELHQTERFSGLLVIPSKGTLDDIEARLRQWTAAIKQRAEALG